MGNYKLERIETQVHEGEFGLRTFLAKIVRRDEKGNLKNPFYSKKQFISFVVAELVEELYQNNFSSEDLTDDLFTNNLREEYERRSYTPKELEYFKQRLRGALTQ